ncbi:hypothetical protein DLAC_10560 [Tieghemostelium lacteum]|uniref:Uncharacterized protein n=1 Tax=Tieghemostelium lacteum TaxID=361077 RepID=A0A151Z4S1_TIELA|nr:hypothetical protein DLAC_10560 [Tieghemostelium lacteum]|eukprot:KYQ88969.1 hypothetical protein DLAC_10560 [Tieghemostelium lacteum]
MAKTTKPISKGKKKSSTVTPRVSIFNSLPIAKFKSIFHTSSNIFAFTMNKVLGAAWISVTFLALAFIPIVKSIDLERMNISETERREEETSTASPSKAFPEGLH